jgi:hypothetical protein
MGQEVRVPESGPTRVFCEADLTFLLRFPQLRSIEVYSSRVTDIGLLAELPRIEVLGLQTKARTVLSASDFPSLRVAQLHWARGMEGLLSAPWTRLRGVRVSRESRSSPVGTFPIGVEMRARLPTHNTT